MNREDKKKATRNRIIEVAVQLFAEQGYDATTVKQITEKAGYAKGTFFNYFRTKEDVLNHLFQDWAVDEVFKLKNKPGPIAPRIKAAAIQLIHRMKLSRPLARVLLENKLSNEKSRANHILQIAKITQEISSIYAEKQESGELGHDIPPDIMAQLTVQTYFGVLLHWAFEQGDDNLTDQMAISLEVFFRGLINK